VEGEARGGGGEDEGRGENGGEEVDMGKRVRERRGEQGVKGAKEGGYRM